jgi:hypothetical protein
MRLPVVNLAFVYLSRRLEYKEHRTLQVHQPDETADIPAHGGVVCRRHLHRSTRNFVLDVPILKGTGLSLHPSPISDKFRDQALFQLKPNVD